RERLRAVIGPPSPLLVDRPERDVSKQDDRSVAGMPLEIFLEPLELLRAEGAEPSRLQVHDIDQADKVRAALIKAIPAGAATRCAGTRPLAEAIAVLLPVVGQHVVLARYVEDVA